MTIAQKFRSVGWVAAVSTAALSCYLISYRVAVERDALEDVEREIAQATDDILALNTEFETRSRMAQIERWNRRDFVLAAPSAVQVLDGEFELASLLESPIIANSPGIMLASARSRDEQGASSRDERSALASADIEFASHDEPRLRRAAYIVPTDNDEPRRAQQIAFLDDQLRDEIAFRAMTEQAGEGVRN